MQQCLRVALDDVVYPKVLANLLPNVGYFLELLQVNKKVQQLVVAHVAAELLDWDAVR